MSQRRSLILLSSSEEHRTNHHLRKRYRCMLRADVAITEEQKRAICRIVVPRPRPPGGTPRRGTGFLVDANRILTAAHVVQAWEDTTQQYEGTDIEVAFLNPGGSAVRVSSVKITSFDAERDFAVLSFQGTVDARPFALRAVPSGYALPWETFGFSEVGQNGGKEYSGKVSTLDPRRLQLDLKPQSEDPSGLSGSACLVNGQVCGIIVEADARTTAGTLYAVNVASVAAACSFVRCEVDDPPYVSEVQQILDDYRPLLRTAAERLGIANPLATITPDGLPGRVAEEMMKQGLVMTGRALSELCAEMPIAEALEVLLFSARTWIDRAASVCLRAALEAGQLVILNTGLPVIGEWYTHRAGCLKNNAPGWFRCTAALVAEAGDPKVFAHRFRETVAGLIGCTLLEVDAELSDWDHDGYPIVILVPAPSLPPRQQVDAIRKDHPWDKVRIVFLVGPEVPPDAVTSYADASVIQPPLVAEESDRALERKTKAEKQLRRVWDKRPGANR
ncbi:hypothetical protein BE04_07830 [Sorangium cellulosum]|uniref:Serine protease n=1 Tax=Sorangium cellulosum TaxID=56 RepID=A0A150P9I8_SORCE|nr:hypothetical protein BE04_07830 [Sorangium cellulosum]